MNYLRKVIETIETIKIMTQINGTPTDPTQLSLLRELMYNIFVMKSKIQTWIDNGEKTFVLTKDLIEALVNTDIPWELTPADFNYPFQTFMIEGQTPLFETHIPKFEYLRPVHGILYLDNKIILNDPKVRWENADGTMTGKPEWNTAITGFYTNFDNNLESLMIHMKEHETIRTNVETKKPGTFMYPLDDEDSKCMINLFFNAVLYINDPSRNSLETEEHRIRTVKDSKDSKFRECKYIILRAPKTYRSLSSGIGRKLDKRFIVRGHWWPRLNNAISEKPRRWVTPFWKGPELSEIIKKPYFISK